MNNKFNLTAGLVALAVSLIVVFSVILNGGPHNNKEAAILGLSLCATIFAFNAYRMAKMRMVKVLLLSLFALPVFAGELPSSSDRILADIRAKELWHEHCGPRRSHEWRTATTQRIIVWERAGKVYVSSYDRTQFAKTDTDSFVTVCLDCYPVEYTANTVTYTLGRDTFTYRS